MILINYLLIKGFIWVRFAHPRPPLISEFFYREMSRISRFRTVWAERTLLIYTIPIIFIYNLLPFLFFIPSFYSLFENLSNNLFYMPYKLFFDIMFSFFFFITPFYSFFENLSIILFYMLYLLFLINNLLIKGFIWVRFAHPRPPFFGILLSRNE
jgi:hypothetical protein